MSQKLPPFKLKLFKKSDLAIKYFVCIKVYLLLFLLRFFHSGIQLFKKDGDEQSVSGTYKGVSTINVPLPYLLSYTHNLDYRTEFDAIYESGKTEFVFYVYVMNMRRGVLVIWTSVVVFFPNVWQSEILKYLL